VTDRDVVTVRLDLIARLLADLDSVGDVTAARLDQDRILRHAVERILAQLVELAVSVNSHIAVSSRGTAPATYRQSFLDAGELGVLPDGLAARLAVAAGLRNVLAHEYVAIDVELVAAAVPAARRDFRQYLKAVAAYLGPEPRP
jgi:uncharacterized protein YutE (UPF0331/DUF86 family)